MLDKVCCTVVKPWNLLLWMRQHCIGWSVVWYTFTKYVYIIYHYIQNIFKKWIQSDLKPIPLDLYSDNCSTELARLTQEWSIQSMFTQEVTSKKTKLWLNVVNWAGLTPPKVTLCLIYFHYCATLFQFQPLDFFCYFTHLFFDVNHELWSSRILLRDIHDIYYCVMVFWFKIKRQS